MARRPILEEIEPHERWLISYADLMTLLFAFFVVMYAVSSVNDGKYRVLSESLVAAFRSSHSAIEPIQVGRPVRSPYRDSVSVRQSPVVVVPSRIPLPVHPLADVGVLLPAPRGTAHPETVVAHSPAPASPAETADMVAATALGPAEQAPASAELSPVQVSPPPPDPLAELADRIRDSLPELVARDEVRVRAGRLSVEVEIRNRVLFDSASATINPSAIPLMAKAAAVLREISNSIRVEGHTDDMPINTVLYPSNWELSAARAASVVHLLSRQGVSPQRLSAVGFGEHQPLGPNDTVEARSRNRRVTIVVLADSAFGEVALERVGVSAAAATGALLP